MVTPSNLETQIDRQTDRYIDRQTDVYLQCRICVRIVVGQVAYVFFVFKGHSKGQSVKSLLSPAMCWTEVIPR